MGSLVMANAFQDKINNKNIEENKVKNEEDEESEDEEDEKEEIKMMPMADMLNHKTGFNNVYTLYEYLSFTFNLIRIFFLSLGSIISR
jgi:SET domain-containing protein 6